MGGKPKERGSSRLKRLTIQLLGGFAVRRGDEVIPDPAWRRRKAKSLFKLVVLAPDRSLSRDRAMDLLWPEKDAGSAANNLHATLFVLRRTLEPDLAEGAESAYLRLEGERIRLSPDLVAEVDAETFARDAQQAMSERDPVRLEEALHLYRGDFLPEDLYEDWAAPRREELRHLYLKSLMWLARYHLSRRSSSNAIEWLEALLAADPIEEEAHRLLISTYAVAGRRHDALRQFQRCRDILRRELDVDPLPETTATYEGVLSGEIGPSEEAPALLGPSLVGREPELEELQDTLEQAREGQGSLVLVVGEMGVGKTRLAQELLWRARWEGLDTLQGAAAGIEGALAYAPLVEALRPAVWRRPELLSRAGPETAVLFPEAPSKPSGPPLDAQAARQRLFEGVLALLTAIAERGPVLVCLEDVHDADESTLQLLHFLSRRIRGSRVLIVATLREEALRGFVRTWRAELEASALAHVLTLGRLTLPETTLFLHGLLGARAPVAVAQTAFDATGGNPLYLQELVQSWRQRGELEAMTKVGRAVGVGAAPATGRLAPRMKAILESRLAGLTAPVRGLLEVAATAGRDFSYPLARSFGLWEEASLVDLLDQALEARVLEEVPEGYRFRHGLIQETLYQTLSAARRAHHHRVVASALECLPDAKRQEHTEDLAYHHIRAGQWEQAMPYLLSAAQRAMERFAPIEATAFLDRALQALDRLPAPDPDLAMRVHGQRGQALMAQAEFGRAVESFQKLLELAEAADKEQLMREAMSALAMAGFWGHRLDQATRYSELGLELSTRARDPLNAARCAGTLGCVLLSRGKLDEGERHLRDLLETSERLGDTFGYLEALACIPVVYNWRGDYDSAIHLLERGLQVAREERVAFWLGHILFFLGLAHGGKGDYERALGYFQEGERFSREGGDRFTLVRVTNCIGWVYHELYQDSAAREYDEEAAALARQFPWPEPLANALVNLALDHVRVGEVDAAAERLAEARALETTDEWMRWRWAMRTQSASAELSLARGDFGGTRRFAEETLRMAERAGAKRYLARGWLHRGLASLEAGSVGRAEEDLTSALELAVEIGNPHLIWRSGYELGRIQEAIGREPTGFLKAERAISSTSGRLGNDLREDFLAASRVQEIRAAATRAR